MYVTYKEERKMKLFVIVTRMYQNGDEFDEWGCDDKIHRFHNHAFFCIKGNEYTNEIEGRVEKGKQIEEIIKSILSKIEENLKNFSITEIGIIFHPHFEADSQSANPIHKRWGEFVGNFKKKKDTKISNIQIAFIENYSSAMIRKDIYKKIETLCRSCGAQVNNSDDLIKELWEYFSKEKKNEENVKPFSLLKHRIAHLFLPLDIDLQGIKEVKKSEARGQKQDGTSVRYLEDVLKDKEPAYYRKKLADLWFIIAGGKVDFSKANGALECKNGKITQCEPVPLTDEDKQNLLADGMSILDLIEKSEKKEEIKKSNEWENLLELAGLKNVNDNKYEPKKFGESPILKFMCELDSRITDQKYDEIDKILKFDELDKMLASDFSHLTSDISFHRWFCALDECLDKLRSELKEDKNRKNKS